MTFAPIFIRSQISVHFKTSWFLSNKLSSVFYCLCMCSNFNNVHYWRWCVAIQMQALEKTGLREGKICWAWEKLVANWLLTLSSETPSAKAHTKISVEGKQSIKRLRTKYKRKFFTQYLSMALLYYWDWENKHIFLESIGCCNPTSANWHPIVLVSLLLLKVTHTVELLNQLEDNKMFSGEISNS